jgi:multicomponent K+:H+ antiporter subunit F
MIMTAAAITLGLLGAAFLLAGWRLLKGPDAVDRVLALDTLYVVGLALLVVAGIRADDTVYFEAALVIALLGFVGTVAAARFLVRGHIIDDRETES